MLHHDVGTLPKDVPEKDPSLPDIDSVFPEISKLDRGSTVRKGTRFGFLLRVRYWLWCGRKPDLCGLCPLYLCSGTLHVMNPSLHSSLTDGLPTVIRWIYSAILDLHE